MGPGFKYHVVTVSAVFLALTVGLVIGGSFVSPQVVAQQTRVLHRFQLTQEHDSAELQRYQRFVATASGPLLRGKLSGAHVAIVLTGDFADLASRVRDMFALTGATVTSLTTIDRRLDRPESLLAPDLAAVHAASPRVPSDRPAVLRALAGVIARGEGPGDTLVDDLDRASLIGEDSDGDYHTPAGYVVIVAGSRLAGGSRANNVDSPLISALVHQNVTVVECEPSDPAVSDLPAYHARGLDILAVTGADTDTGLPAVALALTGSSDIAGVRRTSDEALGTQ